MQTYKTVAEVIGFLETYHRQLKELYREHRDTVNSERLQMLLTYMSRHKKKIQDVFKNINEKDQDIIMKTWVQFVPFTEITLAEKKLIDPEQVFNAIVQQAFEIDDKLIAFYDKMIHQSGMPAPAKKFFQDLITQEEKEKTSVAEAAQQIKNLI